MYFITIKAPQFGMDETKYHQVSLEELLFGIPFNPPAMRNETNTRTYEVPYLSERFLRGFSVEPLIEKLEQFNASTAELREKKREDLYYSFCIPKRSGGVRHIDAPVPELMSALRRLKDMLENDFNAPHQQTAIQTAGYHTAAFAYIKGRSTLDAVKRHQSNESKWFGKLDFHNFFGTTTLDYTMHMLGMIFPFCEICQTDHGREELRTAIELGFLNGILPQGTPLSPTLTNIIMIPIDFKLSSALREYDRQKFVYTRYADDIIVSSRYTFNIGNIERLVINTLRSFNSPYILNREKTRYGSSAGSNWNLGVILNKDNEITVGHKNKRRFQAMLDSYLKDKLNGVVWNAEDIMNVLGLYSYYRMVEKETIDKIVEHVSGKYAFTGTAIDLMKQDLKN